MPGRQNQGRYDTALQSFVHEEDRMRKQTKADGDSSFHGGERFDPFHDPYLADPLPLLRGGKHVEEIAFAMQEFLSKTAG